MKMIILAVSITFSLVSCDSTSDIPIQQVDDYGNLTIEPRDSAQKKPEESKKQVFYFGFDLRSSPQEDAAQYLPFLAYLENATDYTFKLHFTPKGSSSVEELGQNKTQFSAMGATSFLDAETQYNAISLVRGLNQQNQAEYQSVFIVSPKSAIQSIKDFKGKRLAFGSDDSTQGHLVPRIMLMEHTISLTDLARYHYTGSHQNCAEAVVSGEADICGMQDQLGLKLESQGVVKVIKISKKYPSSGIVANQSVPAEVREKVTQALINFRPQGKHSQQLYHWERTEMATGFIAANDSDYLDLKKWAIQFGFIQATSHESAEEVM